jgi:hypothetical protein
MTPIAAAVVMLLALIKGCRLLDLARLERALRAILVAVALLATQTFVDGLMAFSMYEAEQEIRPVQKMVDTMIERLTLATTTPGPAPAP